MSRNGIIFNSKKEEKKQYLHNGYYTIQDGTKKIYAVHRLVAMTYIDNPNNYNVVNHIDENKENNNANNLEWVTQKENCNKHSKEISHPRNVIQKDLQGNILNTYESITEAGIAIGLTRHAVNKACLGINNTAGGYKWEYEDDGHNHKNDVDLANARPIDDYPNYYVFSNGEIFNNQRKSFMKPCTNAHGSRYITLSSPDGKHNKYVHNLVATYFVPNPNNCKNVRHINKDKNNNNINNLEWF